MDRKSDRDRVKWRIYVNLHGGVWAPNACVLLCEGLLIWLLLFSNITEETVIELGVAALSTEQDGVHPGPAAVVMIVDLIAGKRLV